MDRERIFIPGTEKDGFTDEYLKGRIDGYRTTREVFNVIKEAISGQDELDLNALLPITPESYATD